MKLFILSMCVAIATAAPAHCTEVAAGDTAPADGMAYGTPVGANGPVFVNVRKGTTAPISGTFCGACALVPQGTVSLFLAGTFYTSITDPGTSFLPPATAPSEGMVCPAPLTPALAKVCTLVNKDAVAATDFGVFFNLETQQPTNYDNALTTNMVAPGAGYNCAKCRGAQQGQVAESDKWVGETKLSYWTSVRGSPTVIDYVAGMEAPAGGLYCPGDYSKADAPTTNAANAGTASSAAPQAAEVGTASGEESGATPATPTTPTAVKLSSATRATPLALGLTAIVVAMAY